MILLLATAAPFLAAFAVVYFLVRLVVPAGVVVGVILTPIGIIAAWQVFPWPVAVVMTAGLIVVPFLAAPEPKESA